MPTKTAAPAVDYIIYRQSRSVLTVLRRMVNGQYVRVATATSDRDADIIRKAFTDAQPHA